MKCNPIPEREDWFITYWGPAIKGTYSKSNINLPSNSHFLKTIKF